MRGEEEEGREREGNTTGEGGKGEGSKREREVGVGEERGLTDSRNQASKSNGILQQEGLLHTYSAMLSSVGAIVSCG